MTRDNFDAIVIGLGATGSATLAHLAASGARVLGIDRFAPPHQLGSSHGKTRIYRQAYYEAPEYVPLTLRALELWRALERDTGRTLFANTGGVTIGPEDGELYVGALRSARAHGIAHEILSDADLVRRFPVFRPPPDTVALFEPTAGVLFAEACVDAHLEVARARGATLRIGEAVQTVDTHHDGRVIVTTGAASYEAARAVLAAGAWTPMLGAMPDAFRVTRESVHWFTAASAHAAGKLCPVSMIEYGDAPILYTIPDFGDGFKAGLHRSGVEALPTDTETAPGADEIANATRAVTQYAPGGAGARLASASCYYTSTRDGHFAVGEMPGHPGVILASACSGHGFKFASAMGEAVARLALGRAAALPMRLFDPARL